MKTSQKKVLVTGGAGYIGSFAVRQLLTSGYDVAVFDNLSTGFRESVSSRAQLVVGDLREKSDVKKLFSSLKFDAVLHFAAKTVVPDSVKYPDDYFENNFGGSQNLFNEAVSAGVQSFIFSSTAAVYAPTDKEMIDETDACRPLNPYGESKLLTEKYLAELAENLKINVTSLRYFNVAGASLASDLGQKTKNATHLIKVACEVAAGKRKQLEVFGTDYETVDGSAVRDYIHVEDLVAAHLLALESLSSQQGHRILNCGYGRGASVYEVIESVERASGKKLNVVSAPRREGDAAKVVANPAQIKKELSWRPKHDSLDEICRTAFLWEKSIKF